MLNEPSSGKRPRAQHPLERPPADPQTPSPQDPNNPDDQPRQRGQVVLHIPTQKPTLTYLLLAINIGVFVLRAFSQEIDQAFFLAGANHPPDVLVNGEYHRLVTSMFLHASIFNILGEYSLQSSLHLVFNMYMLYVFGSQLESLFGHTRYAVIYLLGGVTGSLLSTVLNPPQTYSVGASGAVFAIMGAHFIFLYRHRKLLGERAQQQMRSLIIWGLINFGFGALTSATGGLRIDNWGHLGGLIGGLALAWFIAPNFVLRTHPDSPSAFLAVDVNPLKRKQWVSPVYVSVLLGVLIVASLIARG